MTTKKTKPIEHTIDIAMLETPLIPGFIRLGTYGTVAIEKLSDTQLKLIGARWTEKLLNNARARRAKP